MNEYTILGEITATDGKRVTLYYDRYSEWILSESGEIISERVESYNEALEEIKAMYYHETWELETDDFE